METLGAPMRILSAQTRILGAQMGIHGTQMGIHGAQIRISGVPKRVFCGDPWGPSESSWSSRRDTGGNFFEGDVIS